MKKCCIILLVALLSIVNCVGAMAETNFTDVPKTHENYRAIKELQRIGVVDGFPDGSFKPTETVTRAEFATMILPFAWDVDVKDNQSFADVKTDDWFYDAVQQAGAKQIIMGNEGIFDPNGLIKKEDAALIIYRLLAAKGQELRIRRFFNDRNDISLYAKSAVEALGAVDIINGDDSGSFRPKEYLTRGDAVQFMYNAFVVGR